MPWGSRASSCSVALPVMPWDSCATELERLWLATCEANSNATPAAMPMTAKHSCTRRARTRTRYRCSTFPGFTLRAPVLAQWEMTGAEG